MDLGTAVKAPAAGQAPAPRWPSMFLLDPAQYAHARARRARAARPVRPVHPSRILPLLIAGTPCPVCGEQFMATPNAVGLLALTAHGYTPGEAARRLRTSRTQVDADLDALADGLGATNTCHAVDTGHRSGLLRLPARPRRLLHQPTAAALAVLQGMADGRTDSETGLRIGRTARAVNEAVNRFLRLHGVRTRPDGVTLLHRARLLDATHPCPCWITTGTNP
ncbi:hypothetical protein ABTY61_23120 [Kitasatospora sp. NPDC096128]|uniref:helix-turn-helix transcriptional regulator n=1 Tax=Kitasatospora sp. NPDC096128 TaxID=3155547 RepID=UPI00332B668B